VGATLTDLRSISVLGCSRAQDSTPRWGGRALIPLACLAHDHERVNSISEVF
jgi:hypothetical protein